LTERICPNAIRPASPGDQKGDTVASTAHVVVAGLEAPEVSVPNRLALPVVLAGVFMAGLDFFIVNVAIPSIQGELHASGGAIQLVVAAYAVAYACGLITAGRLGDVHGRRRVFGIGLGLFTLASALCGFAPTDGVLILARAGQGIAAALMAPQVLAILRTAYDGESRIRAFNAYGLTLGISAVFGQLIGGILIAANIAGLGWRACFLINVPVGLIALALTFRVVPDVRAPHRGRLDILGALLATAALIAIVLPLIIGRQEGWPLWTILSLIGAGPLIVLLALQQRLRRRRSADSALIDGTLLGDSRFRTGLAAQLVFWMGQASFFLVFALFTQGGHAMEPLAAGAIFGAIGLGYITTSIGSARLVRLLGRNSLAVGAAVMAAGLVLQLATVMVEGIQGDILWLAPALFIDGAGMGLIVAPLVATILAKVPTEHAGAASGMLGTTQQVGNALGVAIIGIVFYGALGGARGLDAYAPAFACSLVYLVAVALVVAALAMRLTARAAEV
jgi:MFS family permease